MKTKSFSMTIRFVAMIFFATGISTSVHAGFSPAGSEFRVNTTTADAQQSPAIAMPADGRVHIAPIVIFSDGFESGSTSAWSVSAP